MSRSSESSAEIVSLCEIRGDGLGRVEATAQDQVSYIEDLLGELRVMALQARASKLADMLAVARREAGRLALRSDGA